MYLIFNYLSSGAKSSSFSMLSIAKSESYNCYGNAIGKQIVTDPSNYRVGDDVEKTFLAVQSDLGGEKNCIRLEHADSFIEEGWYRVAMMCGPTDYHFIRQTDWGWYNKSGHDSNFEGVLIDESLVMQDTWYPIGVRDGIVMMFPFPYYHCDDGPLFFAVRIGWDKE